MAGRFVPFAIAILATVLVDILDFHLTMYPGGIGLGLAATLLRESLSCAADPASFASSRFLHLRRRPEFRVVTSLDRGELFGRDDGYQCQPLLLLPCGQDGGNGDER